MMVKKFHSRSQIIAFALDVQADSLTLRFQQVRKIDLFKVTEGKELSNMAQATSIIDLGLMMSREV